MSLCLIWLSLIESSRWRALLHPSSAWDSQWTAAQLILRQLLKHLSLLLDILFVLIKSCSVNSSSSALWGVTMFETSFISLVKVLWAARVPACKLLMISLLDRLIHQWNLLGVIQSIRLIDGLSCIRVVVNFWVWSLSLLVLFYLGLCLCLGIGVRLMLSFAKKIFRWRGRLWVASLITRHTWGRLNLQVLLRSCCSNRLSIVLTPQIVAGALLLKALIQVAVWLINGCASNLIILHKLRAGIVISMIGDSSFWRRNRWTFLAGFTLGLTGGRWHHSTILHPILVLILALLSSTSRILSFIVTSYSIFGCIIWAWHNVAKFKRHGRVERWGMLELLPTSTIMKVMIIVVCRCGWSSG